MLALASLIAGGVLALWVLYETGRRILEDAELDTAQAGEVLHYAERVRDASGEPVYVLYHPEPTP